MLCNRSGSEPLFGLSARQVFLDSELFVGDLVTIKFLIEIIDIVFCLAVSRQYTVVRAERENFVNNLGAALRIRSLCTIHAIVIATCSQRVVHEE